MTTRQLPLPDHPSTRAIIRMDRLGQRRRAIWLGLDVSAPKSDFWALPRVEHGQA